MNRMPNIELTRFELEMLEARRSYKTGGEGSIYFSDSGTLYKIFIDPYSKRFIGMPENKFEKIVRLYQEPLDYSVKPLSTISSNGRLLGYEMERKPNYKPLSVFMYRKELIFYLKEIKSILEYYASKDITYGDIKLNNILINRRSHEVMFCDMDNIRLGKYPIDLVGLNLEDFIDGYGRVDEVADIYMHNLLTLKCLNYKGDSYSNILCGIKDGTYPTRFEKSALPIIKSMIDPANFTGEYIIQYVKK